MKKLLSIIVLGLMLSGNAYSFNFMIDLGMASPDEFIGIVFGIIIVIFFILKLFDRKSGFDAEKWESYNNQLKKERKKMLKTHNLNPKTGFYTKKKKKLKNDNL